jgi:hypothetical protein
LDPEIAKTIVSIVARELSEIDVANKSTYEANAKKAINDLDTLIAETRSKINSDATYIVFHDAYQYFEKRFGIEVIGALTVNPEVLPGAKQLAEIREVIEHEKVNCLFSEMTTVGYGDTIPVSNAGRLVGGLAMLGGIIMLALPTTVFGAQFAEEYSTMKSDAALEKLRTDRSGAHEREDDEAELKELKAELKQIRDLAQEMLPTIHKRLHTYLGPSGRATNFNRGECIMKDLKTGLIELYDFVDELSPNISVDDAGAP